MKPSPSYHRFTSQFFALGIALHGLISASVVAQSAPDVKKIQVNSIIKSEWVAPAPVKSSESRPPQVVVLEKGKDMEFKEAIAADPVELKKSRVLRMPVVRSKKRGPTTSVGITESGILGRALVGYQKAGGGETVEGRKALEGYLERYAEGDYSPSVSLELADAYWRIGSWEKALDLWEKAWSRSAQADESDIVTRRLGDVILSELLTHTALLGRKERLRAILEATKGRQHGADAAMAIRRANELIWFLENRAEQNVQCGFSSANLVCVPLGQKAIFPDVHSDEEKKTFIEKGCSLWDIAEHSTESGGSLRCVQKIDPAAPFAVPSVVHWKFGHYSALTARSSDDKIRMEDAQLRFNSWVEPSVITEGGSGYALIPGGNLPVGYREVPEFEARKVFGRHCRHGNDDEGKDCETGCSTASKHMATYSLNLRLAHHLLADSPLSYPTPDGDEVMFGLKYSAMPKTFTALEPTFGFGPGWFADFAGGYMEHKGTGGSGIPNSMVRWVSGTGTFNTYTLTTNGVYTKNQQELPDITFIPPPVTASGSTQGAGYRLTFSDGSIQEFTERGVQFLGRYTLTRTVNPQGRERKLGYLWPVGHLRTITDEWGKVSVISYVPEPGDLASQLYFPELIRRITDPHGRYATFIYDSSGRLKKITDPLGVTSEFVYGNGDVITSLTTPYGTTNFELTQTTGTTTTVIVTDPRGFKEKVVQTDDEPLQILNADGSLRSGASNALRVRDWNADGELGDPTAQAPSSVGSVTFLPKNNNLHWRNSFYWDKKAMYQSPTDWNAATSYNWAATSSFFLVPTLASIREYGKGRVWFNNPGQIAPDGQRTSYHPSKTVRQVENNGTPTWVMTQQTYNSLGLPLLSTDENGRQIRTTYAGNNQDVTSVAVLAGSMEVTTLGGGWAQIPAFEALQSFTYNPSNRLPSTITAGAGLLRTLTYNAKSQVTQVQKSKQSNVETERYTYSATGAEAVPAWPGTPGFLRKIERTDPANAAAWVTVNLLTYDSVGRVRTYTDAADYVRTLDYDNFDRVTLITHPDGTTEQYVYGSIDPSAPTVMKTPLDLTATKDRAGRWSRTVYNSDRQPVTQIAPDGKTTLLEWCLCGQLQKLTDPLGRETKWTWDIGGFLLNKIMPDGVTKTSYTYEANSGKLSTVTTPNDQAKFTPTVTYRYFSDGRMKSEDFTDLKTPDVSYRYELQGLGRLNSVTDGIGTHRFLLNTFGYGDGAGQMWSVDGPLDNDTLTRTYDWQNRLTTEIQADKRIETRIFDSLGRITSIANTLGNYTFGYNTSSSRLDNVTGPNSVFSALAYLPNSAPGDSASKLASITHTRAAIRQAKHIYSYDIAGRTTAWEQQSIGQPSMKSTYLYNRGDELVSADDTNLATNTRADHETWALDQAGNWLSHTQSAGSILQTRTVDEMNRLLKIGGAGSTVVEGRVNEFASVQVNGEQADLNPAPASGGYFFKRSIPVKEGANTVQITATDPQGETTVQNWNFTVPSTSRNFVYDANGNTLSDGIRTYTWDAKNRLKTVTKAGSTWNWDYDFQDRRIKEYQNGQLTKLFIWSGNQIIQERNASNVITRTHYEGGFIDGATPATGTKYQTLTDHLGNVREVLTATGAIAARYDYTAYQGAVKIGTSTVDPTFLTIGNYYHHAGSGLDLALYRAYDPELGRWLSVDPIGEAGGLNLYGYVGNDPVNWIDPDGLDRWIVGQFHTGIVVEDPTSSTCYSRYDFGPSGFPWVYSKGIMPKTEVERPNKYTHRIRSTPEQDRVLRETAELLMESPEDYSILGNNCRHVTSTLKDAGFNSAMSPFVFTPIISDPFGPIMPH